MFHDTERELLDGEDWLFGQQAHLPHDLELSDQQKDEICDVWELPLQESTDHELIPQGKIKKVEVLSKLKSFCLKAIAQKITF
ncbi:hypothetical protein [Nostoc sp. TCL26-01]|uniref:hypothetical protein n=1 Tax=Nostoc sp. TCL26-01 TaxID=2576904 RepID=UPI0015C17DDE|nr:hypothetical protein [Nostoc sp. TCL26-01]QLE57917.1 hypothetical protein FD725_21810 [Nostoc sp. TCL26-01]